MCPCTYRHMCHVPAQSHTHTRVPFTYRHIHVPTHSHTHTHVPMHLQTYVPCAHTLTYTPLCAHALTYVPTHSHTHPRVPFTYRQAHKYKEYVFEKPSPPFLLHHFLFPLLYSNERQLVRLVIPLNVEI